MLDRKVKRPAKEEALIKKLGEDKYNFAYNINTKPFPSWVEAFDYAYRLGYSRGILYDLDPEMIKRTLK